MRWQWNAAGPAEHDECVYDAFREVATHPGETQSALNPAFTGNWFDLNQPGWGIDLLVGIDANQRYHEVDTIQIYDLAGDPVWLQAETSDPQGSPPPNDNSAAPNRLRYLKSTVPDGLPISDCSSNCFSAYVSDSNLLTRNITSANSGTASIRVAVPADATGSVAIDWPRAPVVHPSNIYRGTQYRLVTVDRPVCTVPTSASTCDEIVSWSTNSAFDYVFRRNLQTNVVDPEPIGRGGSGEIHDTLPLSARVRYEMRANSSATGPLVSQSPEVRVVGHIEVSDDTPVSLSGDLPKHQSDVGEVTGSATVDGGAASYTIPIQIPPGRAGLQPELAITYSSRGGNGIAGMGFGLSGLSSIHRCPKTLAQDGIAAAVTLGSDDALCLDGQRLLRTEGSAAGQAGAVYKTEIDSFVRVTQVGGDLAGNSACFKVETKSGRIMHFGATVAGSSCTNTGRNSRVTPVRATPVTLSWLLEKTEDQVGNNVFYNYVTFNGSETLIQDIYYTGRNASAGNRRVQFVYADRPSAGDRSVAYLSGGLTTQSKRLANITTYVGSSAVRRYQASYTTTGGVQASNYSGRSLVQKIEECVLPSGKCLPPTVVAWNDRSQLDKDQFKRFLLDGLPGPTLPTAAEISAEFEPYTVSPDPSDPDARVGKDGQVDPPEVEVITRATENYGDVSYLTVLGDVNGDGTRELFYRQRYAANSYHYYIAQSTADRRITAPVQVDELALSGIGASDIDGDGISDTLRLPLPGEPNFYHVTFWKLPRGSWGTSFGQMFASRASNLPFGGTQLIKEADFDGDGRPDLLLRTLDGAPYVKLVVAPIESR